MNKKIAVWLLLCVFLILLAGPVSAKVKTYDDKNQKFTIKNSFLGIPTSNLATIKLNTPLVYNVGAGYQKVAEFELVTFKKYNSAFNRMEFFDKKNNMNLFSRDFDYKYKTTEQFPYYQTVCDQITHSNGTTNNNCHQEQNGFVDKVVWKELENSNFKKDENITIGIFTTVEVGDYVEWIPTFFDKRLTEWAVWTSDLNTELIVYYKLDEAAASGGVIIDSVGHQNATNIGAANESGKILSAYNFSSDYITIADNASLEPTDEFSIQAWVNADTSTGNHVILDKGDNANAFALIVTGGILEFRITNSNIASATKPTNNVWSHVVATWDGATQRLYINGNNVANNSFSGSLTQNANNVSIGSKFDGSANYWDGGIDEVGFWSRDLTLAEVKQLYNGGTGISYQKIVGLPTITLIAPENNSNLTFNKIEFTCLPTDNESVTNVTLYIDDLNVSTNTSGLNNTNYNFSQQVSYTNHNWTCQVCDNSNNCVNATKQLLNVSEWYENSQTYTSSVLGGSSTTFSLNISYNSTEFDNYQINLQYNGTNYTSTRTGSNPYIFNRTLTLPIVTASTNITFNWTINLNNGTDNNFLSTSNNQTITTISIDNCSTNTEVLYNFTIVDEATQSKLAPTTKNTTSNVNLKLYTLNRATEVASYNTSFNRTNPFSICFDNNLTDGSNYVIDVEIKYKAANYVTEYYNIQNSSIINADFPTNITLYNLLNTSSTAFTITYRDNTFLPVPDALIQVQRKYVSEGVFKTVEIPKTDFDGETIAHLVSEDVIYTFIATKNGVVLDTFSNLLAQCASAVLGDCTIELNSFGSSVTSQDYTTIDDFSFTLTYDDSTRIVESVFSIPSGTPKLVSLNTTLLDSDGTSACSNSLTSASGTLSCTIPTNLGNATAIVAVYSGGDLMGTGTIKLGDSSSDIFGGNLIFLLMMLYLTIFGVAISDNPMMTGISLLVGAIIAIALNLVDGTFIGVGATVLWLVIAVVIVLIKGSRRQ